MDTKRRNNFIPFEALVWLGGLLFLAAAEPSALNFSICPLHRAGLDFCPGCGLGKSIGFLFHGQFKTSWEAHPLGIPAVFILTLRIFSLTKNHFHAYGKNY